MSFSWKRMISVCCCLGLLWVWGCHEEPAPDRYPEDLGEGEVRLLPTVSGGYSPDILQGQANVVEREETAEAGPRPAREEPAAADQPAKGWGRWLAEGLGAGKDAAATPEPPPGRGGRGGRGPSAPATGPVQPEDEAAIRERFQEYSDAKAQALHNEAVNYLVEDQREIHEVMAEPNNRLLEAIRDIGEEYASSAPQTARAAKVVLERLTFVGQLNTLGMVDADRAEGRGDPGAPTYVFERTAEGWLIRSPFAFTAAEAEEYAKILRDTTTLLEEVMDGLEAGKLDDTSAGVKMAEALQAYEDQYAPIIERVQGRSRSG